MESQRQEILDKSTDIIEQLSLLAFFFEDVTLMNIYLQTQIIHKLFQDNEDIDINKLELFHLQFTSTLVTLLSKIKQKNERAVQMYQNEIDFNNQMIEKMRQLIAKEGGFDAEKLEQSKRMSKSLRSLYTAIYNKSTAYPFTEDISSFCIRFYKEYFFESTQEIYDKITTYDKADTYKQSYARIDKQLLLTLGQANFKVIFFAGVRFDPILVELYKIETDDMFFLFLPAKNLFLRCDIELFPYREWEAEMSKKKQVIKNLIKNNLKAEANIKNSHRYISHEISELLKEDYKAITDIDFLASLEDINTQANILKAMLETKMI